VVGRGGPADPGVDVPVQVLELVLHRGLGLAGDLAPDPPAGLSRVASPGSAQMAPVAGWQRSG
jgi:hypothetical protein